MPAGGGEKKSAQTTASAAARGVDPERDAKGGSNPKPVPVRVTAADVAAFKKEGGLAGYRTPSVVNFSCQFQGLSVPFPARLLGTGN